jgi:hypothetical protein
MFIQHKIQTSSIHLSSIQHQIANSAPTHSPRALFKSMSCSNTDDSDDCSYTRDLQQAQLTFVDSIIEWIRAVNPTDAPFSVSITNPNLRKCIEDLYFCDPPSERIGTPPDSSSELKIEEQAARLIKIVTGETAERNGNDDSLGKRVKRKPKELNCMFERLLFLKAREDQQREHLRSLELRLRELRGN